MGRNSWRVHLTRKAAQTAHIAMDMSCESFLRIPQRWNMRSTWRWNSDPWRRGFWHHRVCRSPSWTVCWAIRRETRGNWTRHQLLLPTRRSWPPCCRSSAPIWTGYPVWVGIPRPISAVPSGRPGPCRWRRSPKSWPGGRETCTMSSTNGWRSCPSTNDVTAADDNHRPTDSLPEKKD